MSDGSLQVNRNGNLGISLETSVDVFLEDCWGGWVQEQYTDRWMLDKCTVARIMLTKSYNWKS